MSARSAVLFAAALTLTACQSATPAGDESMCQKRKPGTIVTVNEYCVMVPVDPVDPNVVIEWNGQKVGLCCKGCIPKWEKLSATERDAAVRAAIAKGPIDD